MATRPVFVPSLDTGVFVRTESIDFLWHAGLSTIQKRRSIDSLHEAARMSLGLQSILEISSKSVQEEGVSLSAFNLKIATDDGTSIPTECAFQGSKVFQNGGPFLDIYNMHPKDAKKDSRLRNSGPLIGFHYDGRTWDLTPRTAFYDWVYLSALVQNRDLAASLIRYQAFTDIEFNPKKSLNCQAYSAALYSSLNQRGLAAAALSSPERFLETIQSENLHQSSTQGDLF